MSSQVQYLQCRHHFDGAGFDKVDGGAMSRLLVVLLYIHS